MQKLEAKKLIGNMECPECGHGEAEIKTDKSANPYRYCGNCNAQYFTRGDAVRVRNMLAKMRPIAPAAVEVAPVAVAPAAVEVAPVAVAPAVEVKREKTKAEKMPAAMPKKRGFFDTILDGGAA